MRSSLAFLIGVDGGGSGTRVRIEHPDGSELGTGLAGASALAHGIEKAWIQVMHAIDQGFGSASMETPPPAQLGLGLGLAGVHNPRQAAQFREQDPGFGALALASDGMTTLLGAHDGAAGAIIAIGTGSIGEILTPTGAHREVGGWGFPAGDEAGGAWIGLRAMGQAQRLLDGRLEENGFARAVVNVCGGTRAAVFDWLSRAGQTEFATLARIVVEHAEHDASARAILLDAGVQIARIANALDPDAQLPLALCGGLAMPLRPYLPPTLQARAGLPKNDSMAGALLLLRRQLGLANQPGFGKLLP